jgi:hydrogenase maturation protease
MRPDSSGRRALIACVGNILRSDDGVGPRVAELLEDRDLPDGVDVLDFGIGGVHLVQTLLTGEYRAMVLVDCADRDREPGTVMVIEPDVLDVSELEGIEKYDYLADMHYTNPERAMALAKALGALPTNSVLIGIQPLEAERLGRELSPAIERAAHVAADEAVRISLELLDGHEDE